MIWFGFQDGEKRYCGTTDFGPDCLIISLGSDGDFSFEEDIFARTKCRIETFDCTGTWEVPMSIASRTRIHKYCIGAGENLRPDQLNWRSLLTKTIKNHSDTLPFLGLSHAPKYVKMDIEGFEYEILYEMVQTLPRHLLPETIALEVHGPWTGIGLHIAIFFDYLFRYGGYVVLDRRDASPCCTEIILSRVFD